MEAAKAKKNNHGANIRRWREWRGVNQDVLAEQIGVSQATLSGYEKRDKLEPEMLDKIAKALDVPTEAITELEDGTAINIISNTFNDNAAANDNAAGVMNYYHPTFNPIDKIAELYERLLKSEQEKVAILQEIIQEKK